MHSCMMTFMFCVLLHDAPKASALQTDSTDLWHWTTSVSHMERILIAPALDPDMT